MHGAPGAVVADSDGKAYTFEELWQKYRPQIEAVNGMLESGASLLIMGCNVGAGSAGDSFLIHFSEKFPGHKVAGITTIGETMRQSRSGGGCSEPGMKDTSYDNPSTNMPKIKEEREKEFLTLPWASEDSPHAKVAFNGQIIRRPTEAVAAKTNYSVITYLPGTWSATIGDWNGYFIFEAGETCYWTDDTGKPHYGTWWMTSDSVQWSFDDDPLGWKRVFTVTETGLQSTLHGAITIKGISHGAFVMSKQSDDPTALGELFGKWQVRVDRWLWIYEFDMAHNVRWTDPFNKMTGTGSWKKLNPKSMGIFWKNSKTAETWKLPIDPAAQTGEYLMGGNPPTFTVKATKQVS